MSIHDGSKPLMGDTEEGRPSVDPVEERLRRAVVLRSKLEDMEHPERRVILENLE